MVVLVGAFVHVTRALSVEGERSAYCKVCVAK